MSQRRSTLAAGRGSRTRNTEPDMTPLERYRDVIPDFEGFLEAVQRPEPRTLRVRTGRISQATLVGRLEEQGFGVRPVPRLPDFLEITHQPFPVSESLEHWLGLFYIQQAVTGVAAPLLGPRPGERVLDLCAAPGGKTTHLADLMADQGSIVAADVSEKRLRALLGNVYRTAHTNILALAADGRRFPPGATFDRILADVPCSGEGMARKKGGRVGRTSPAALKRMTRSQEKLLRRAAELVRPGGEILYVTCTYAPEENEAVVSRVLSDTDLEVLPIELDVPHAPGLTRFEDLVFDERLSGAARIYPHHLDSGGLFLCHLRRPGNEAVAGWAPPPPAFPGQEIDAEEAEARIGRGLAYLVEDFGVPKERMDGARWLVRGTNIWLHTQDAWPVESLDPRGGWRVLSLGLRALSHDGRGVRPTTDLIRWLEGPSGPQALTLDREGWLELLSGRTIDLAEDHPDGFVTLCLEEFGIGRGVIRDGRLVPEIPRKRGDWLRKVLERGRG